MPWGFVAAGVGSVLGGALNFGASRNAANDQRDAARQASQTERDMFDIARTQQQPYMQSGYGANDVLSRLLGLQPNRNRAGTGGATVPGSGSGVYNAGNGRLIGDTYLPVGTTTKPVGNKGWYEVWNGGVRIGTLRPGGPNGRYIADGQPIPDQPDPNAGNYTDSGYVKDNTGLADGYLTHQFDTNDFLRNIDPGYGWRLQQGMQGVANMAAPSVGALSGPALKSLIDYNQGAASQEYQNAFGRFTTQQGNIFQRLAAIASLGQNAAAGVGNAGITTGANIGSNIIGAGNAAAAGQIGQANAISSGLSDLGALAYLTANKK